MMRKRRKFKTIKIKPIINSKKTLRVVRHKTEEELFLNNNLQILDEKRSTSVGQTENRNPTEVNQDFLKESSISTNVDGIEKILSPTFLKDEVEKAGITVRTRMVEVLQNFYELKTTKSEASTYRITVRLRLSLKELKKSIKDIKSRYEVVGKSLVSGDFFSWDEFMTSLMSNVYKDKYVKQKDRDTLREVAVILSSETKLSVPDLDAHIRWLIYSIDPKLNIQHELTNLLSQEENNFIWKKDKLEEEFNSLERLLDHINSEKIEILAKRINKTIFQVKKISKGKKRFSKTDIEKVKDIFDDVSSSQKKL